MWPGIKFDQVPKNETAFPLCKATDSLWNRKVFMNKLTLKLLQGSANCVMWVVSSCYKFPVMYVCRNCELLADLPSLPHLAGDSRILEPPAASLKSPASLALNLVSWFSAKWLKLHVATRCHILRLNAPNSISAGAPPPTPLEELRYCTLPDLLAGFYGSYL